MSHNLKFGLGLVIIAMLACGVLAAVESDGKVPQVAYSVETHLPVYLEMDGKKTMIMPGTAVPRRHERIWVP